MFMKRKDACPYRKRKAQAYQQAQGDCCWKEKGKMPVLIEGEGGTLDVVNGGECSIGTCEFKAPRKCCEGTKLDASLAFGF
jgi:hypothetical protein